MRKRFGSIVGYVAVCALLAGVLAGCGTKQEAGASEGDGCGSSNGQVMIGTGNATGVYYALGGGLATLISDNTRMNATALETGASVENIERVVAGEMQVGFAQADTSSSAAKGEDIFEYDQPVEALARVYTEYTHVIVRKGSGITSIESMRGKKISTGSPKSGVEVIAWRLLRAAGLEPGQDMSPQRLGLGDAVDAVKAGTIDGMVFTAGLPTPAIVDLFGEVGDDALQFVDVTPLMPAMQKITPVYAEGTIPAAAYGLAADVPTMVVPTYLLVNEDFPDADACAITKLIFEKKAELTKVHPAAKEISPDTARQVDPVRLHDGARKALDDLGGAYQ